MTDSKELVELYYFDVFEARQLLGFPDAETITQHLKSGKVVGVKVGKKWMVRPDQIAVLRNLIPSCRPSNEQKEQGGKVRFLFPKLLRWWTAVRTFTRLAGIKSSLSD